MRWPLSFQEAQFTPAEAAACTGLTLSAQRSWRSQGFMPVRTTAQSRFSSRELAEIRLMVLLRELGLDLARCRSVAEDVASSVLFIALTDHEADSLAVNAAPDRSERYKIAIDWDKDEYGPRTLSGAADVRPLYLLLQGGACRALADLEHDVADPAVESFGIVNLHGVARALVSKAPRPLFSLIVPRAFV